jgi:serine phosphatase RsbU (regulator of sigma subunit)
VGGRDQRLEIGRLLEAVEGSPPIDAVDVLAAELRRLVDARHVSLLIANLSGNAVVRLSHVTAGLRRDDGRNERAESLDLPGTIYERVLFTQELAVVPEDGGWLVLLPVTERGDAIGLLELSLARHPDAGTIGYLVSAAHALAYVLVVTRRHTDVFEWGQRDRPFSLSAEIQRRLLPSSYTVEAKGFTLAGWLEPANTVGGDTFDYSLEREYLYASITDAMGHAEEAALLATLTVGSLRNSRRQLASPADQANDANAALLTMARPDQFVTGQLIRIRLADGVAEFVNAGHPPPFRVRAGQAAELSVAAGTALGITDTTYDTQEVHLEVGDRLLLVTDGFLERNAVVDLPKILEASAHRHPREVVRELAENVLQVTGGNLQDDATVLCIDWYGLDGERNAIGGASRARATGTKPRRRPRRSA